MNSLEIINKMIENIDLISTKYNLNQSINKDNKDYTIDDIIILLTKLDNDKDKTEFEILIKQMELEIYNKKYIPNDIILKILNSYKNYSKDIINKSIKNIEIIINGSTNSNIKNKLKILIEKLKE